MHRIRGTSMDISFAFAIFCMPIIELVTGHWTLDTNKVKGHLAPNIVFRGL